MVRSGSCGSGARYVLLLRESAVKPVGKPDAGNPHVRFDERGWETGRPKWSAPAPILDSTEIPHALSHLTSGCGFASVRKLATCSVHWKNSSKRQM
jgi:hypothetical protein